MALRVTPQTLVDLTIANASRHLSRLGRLHEQAVTGLRLVRPSDDPIDAMTALANRAQEFRLDTYLNNISEARSVLEIGVTDLRAASDILASARQIALEASNATNDSTSFEAFASQLDSLIDRLVEVANARHVGRALFAGTDTDGRPFVVTAADAQGRPQRIEYQGALENAEVVVGRDQIVKTLYSGSQVFQTRERGPTLFSGQTGVTAGTGTDSATGQGVLIVRHLSTSYPPGSGIQAGIDSTELDTIVGPAGAHTLSLNDTSGTGTSGTVSLNGGAPIPFTNLDTNLKVTAPSGDVIYVDTTSTTPGFNGDVPIAADGTLSTDNGISETPITFGSNQIVQNAQTGAVTNVDSTSIRQAGTEYVDYSGTYDVFQILIALRDDLRNVRGLNQQQQAELISSRINELDRVRNGVIDVIGEQAATLANLESLKQWTEDLRLETQKLRAEIESADITEVVVNIQAQENLLRLTLASAARVMNLSLLDFLG